MPPACWPPSLKCSAFPRVPGKCYQRRSFQKLPSICLWAPGSDSWHRVLAPPPSVGGHPTRQLGPSSLTTQDLAHCPMGEWTGCNGITLDSSYPNLTVYETICHCYVLLTTEVSVPCYKLWFFSSISNHTSRFVLQV